MTKNFWKKLTDPFLSIIETYSGKINSWAWTQRWGKRDPNEWIDGYREWKKLKDKGVVNDEVKVKDYYAPGSSFIQDQEEYNEQKAHNKFLKDLGNGSKR